MSEKIIEDLLINLTDRVVQLQDQFAVVKEIIGDMYEKYGYMMEQLHIIEKVQPKEIKEEKKGVLFKLKNKFEGRKLDKEEKERRKEREKKLQKEKDLTQKWL